MFQMGEEARCTKTSFKKRHTFPKKYGIDVAHCKTPFKIMFLFSVLLIPANNLSSQQFSVVAFSMDFGKWCLSTYWFQDWYILDGESLSKFLSLPR